MIDYLKAKEIALKEKPYLNACNEYDEGYHFFKGTSDEYEDDGFVVIKENGSIEKWYDFILNHEPQTYEIWHNFENGETICRLKLKYNEYDKPFVTMDRKTADRIFNESTPEEIRKMSIEEIVDREIATLSEEDKAYLLEHPDYTEHHFGYGLYLRNEYIHSGLLDNEDEYGLPILCIPDDLSEMLFQKIIESLRIRR